MCNETMNFFYDERNFLYARYSGNIDYIMYIYIQSAAVEPDDFGKI